MKVEVETKEGWKSGSGSGIQTPQSIGLAVNGF